MKTLMFLVSLLLALTGCALAQPPPEQDSKAFRILADPQYDFLKEEISQIAQKEGVKLSYTALGSVDLMLRMQNQADTVDAVWPADSIWLALGNRDNIVKNTLSIMRSPVVLGVKRSKAQQLGWANKEVYVKDILEAIRSGKLRYAMASASQSGSGAVAYFGFLSALKGSDGPVLRQDLKDPKLQQAIKELLSGLDRSSASSTTLLANFLQNSERFDAMINLEALVIQANRDFTAKGVEPLQVIYPIDGLAIADAQLGFIDQGDSKKKEFYQKLQNFLLSKEVQQKIRSQGWRTGLVGIGLEQSDASVFNPAWGIKSQPSSTGFAYPNVETIREALNLYQQGFRRGSFTIYVLDTSGSMDASYRDNSGKVVKRIEALKASMKQLLDPKLASAVMLQGTENDITLVIPFTDNVMGGWKVEEWKAVGNDPAALAALSAKVDGLRAGGGTNIYHPTIRALEVMQSTGLGDRIPAVVLMTDGESNEPKYYSDLERFYQASALKAPVYAIWFGESTKDQLNRIASLTGSTIFDGRSDLEGAFRQVKGQN